MRTQGHYIYLVTETTFHTSILPTSIVFNILKSLATNEPLQIHLWSCFGGSATAYTHYLPLGSVLIAHSPDDRESWMGHQPTNALNKNSYNNIFKGLLDAYDVYLGHPFKISINLGQIASYEVKPMLQLTLAYPHSALQMQIANLYKAVTQFTSLADEMKIYDRAFNTPVLSELSEYSAEQMKNLLGYMFIEYCYWHTDVMQNIITNPDYSQIIYSMNPEFVESNCLAGVAGLQDNNISAALLKYGVGLNSHNTVKAFISAAQKGNLWLVQALINNYDVDPNAYDNMGFAALIQAVKYKHITIVKYLLEQQANPNIQDQRGEDFALGVAAFAANDEMIELLLSYPDTEVNLKNDKHGATALIAAALKGHVSTVKLLLANGAKPDIQNNKGDDVLTYILQAWNKQEKWGLSLAKLDITKLDTIKLLLEHCLHLDLHNPSIQDASSNSDILQIINQYIRSKSDFDNFSYIPTMSPRQVQKYLENHLGEYHDYKCHDMDDTAFAYVNEYGYYEVMCQPAGITSAHDEL